MLPLGCAVGAVEQSEAAIFPKPVEYQAKDQDQKIAAFGSSYHGPAEASSLATGPVLSIVPTLLRGNVARDAPRSASGCDAERHGMHSHAGAWERSKLALVKVDIITAKNFKNVAQPSISGFPVQPITIITRHIIHKKSSKLLFTKIHI
ncbi:hypothetical protein B1219_13720 [Pseudomonas ogarae]|nr:hypothetical protein B1219_13720 [Pseudomonas ogarae]OPG76591.1 hypothetical protein B1218_25315 [Pseudomonas ogarae]